MANCMFILQLMLLQNMFYFENNEKNIFLCSQAYHKSIDMQWQVWSAREDVIISACAEVNVRESEKVQLVARNSLNHLLYSIARFVLQSSNL